MILCKIICIIALQSSMKTTEGDTWPFLMIPGGSPKKHNNHDTKRKLFKKDKP